MRPGSTSSSRNPLLPVALLLLSGSLVACGNKVIVVEVDSGPAERDLSASPMGDMAARDMASPCGVTCSAPTPLCDVKTRRCVACLGDLDCPAVPPQICVQGACRPGCAAGHSSCGDAGACDVDLGVCRGCISNAECTNPRLPVCDLLSGQCAACTPLLDNCPAGQFCRGGSPPACVAGCKNDFECAVQTDAGAHAACCNHVCVDTFTAASDCGACGQSCNGGACCGGRCADTAKDVANCGGCGKACMGMNIVPVCNAGVCGSMGCVMGFGDCDNNGSCETFVASDVANCGSCGKACKAPNAMPLCIGGACSVGGCLNGFLNCNADPTDGCEVAGASDVTNCGSCGNRCANLAHATPGCTNAQCVVLSCDAGYGDCNKKGADGCESQLAADPANCGACGMACPAPPHVEATCAASACGVGGCAMGWGDCDNNAQNGCETDLNTDPKNCAGCGMDCGAGKVCLLGKCAAGDFGGGTDGALTVNATTTINTVRTGGSGTSGSTTVTVSSTNGFAVGQTILIHQTQGQNAGLWELGTVTATGNGTLTVGLALKNSYSSSGANKAQVVMLPQYTDVTVNGGGTLNAPAWDGTSGGILAFQANGKVTVTGTIAMDGRGFRGTSHQCTYQCKDGTAGESATGGGALGFSNNGAGGGGGMAGQDCAEGGGGGYGSAGATGPDGTCGNCAICPQKGGVGGNVVGQSDLTTGMLFGGAGGEGGADEDGAFPGFGGNGGGIILIQASSLTVSGAIRSGGASGGNGDNSACGSTGCGMSGGGGGAGGAIRLLSSSASLGANLVSAPGGVGGACTCSGTGGTGGNGRIAVKSPMVSGSTSPAYFNG